MILLVLLFLDNIVSPNYIGIINFNILPFIPTTTKKNKYIYNNRNKLKITR